MALVGAIGLPTERAVSAESAARVMPLGDSITSGRASLPGDSAYRDALEDVLLGDRRSFDFVGSAQSGPASLADKDHEGHGGFLIADIAAAVGNWLNGADPDVVLLMIGSNDMTVSPDPGGAPGRLASLVDQILARPSTTVIVATIPPQTDLTDPARIQALTNYNNSIPGMVAARQAAGKPVSWVDVYGALTNADLADGIHPNSTGYTKIANVWFGRLSGLLPLLPPLPAGTTTYLSSLTPISASNGYGPYERDLSNGGPSAGDGGPLRIRGVTYAKGLGTAAPSSLSYNLGGSYSRFQATVGVDDLGAPSGSVTFQVFLDGVKVYDSGVVRGTEGPRTIDISVAGKTTLRIGVTDGGDGPSYDQADWAMARVISGSTSTTVPASTTTTLSPVTTTTPGSTTTTTVPGPTTSTYLSALTPISASNGYGPYERDRSNGGPTAGDGGALSIRGVTYAKGLGTAAPSSLSYNLGGSYSRFQATVGVDDLGAPSGSVTFQVFLDGVKVYDSGVVRGTEGPRTIDISVAGKTTLRIGVTDGGDGPSYDQADWAMARVISGSTSTTVPGSTTTTIQPTTTTVAPGAGTTTYLSSLTPISASNGYGPYERDLSNGGPSAGDGGPLRIRGVTYAKGLGTAAPSSLSYNLGGSYSRFQATVGVDDLGAPSGSVTFQVFLDGVKVYDSGVVRGTEGPRTIDISVAGKTTLRIGVTDGGDGPSYDQADWALARVI